MRWLAVAVIAIGCAFLLTVAVAAALPPAEGPDPAVE